MSVIKDYIQQIPDETKRAQVARIYELVHAEVNDAKDGWKYGIPTILYKDLPILGFAVTKAGISIYPYGNSTITPFLEKEIAPYVTGGGTLSFKAGVAIPDELVTHIAQVRKSFVEAKLKK